MRSEMARMRGQDEQIARDVAELQRRQKDVVQGVEDRIRKLEPVKVSLDDKEFLADPEEKRLYEEAFALIRKGDFVNAGTALANFQRRYPVSGYSESVLVLARQCPVRASRIQGGHRLLPSAADRAA